MIAVPTVHGVPVECQVILNNPGLVEYILVTPGRIGNQRIADIQGPVIGITLKGQLVTSVVGVSRSVRTSSRGK